MKSLAIVVAIALTQGMGLAHAEEAGGARGADPADPGSPVVRQAHVSPFASYRPFIATEIASWRGVNDEVGRIGGWRAYAREAYEAAEAARSATASPSAGEAGKPPSTRSESIPGK